MSSPRRLTRVARAQHLHVLLLKVCKRCGKAFKHCRSCEPGRLYCTECSPLAAREREQKAHRRYYRETPEGRRQHHDEEHERRKRRCLERKGATLGGRDRRCAPVQGRLEMLATAAHQAAQEPRRVPLSHRAPVEWLLVAWPGLLAAARRQLGAKEACTLCGRQGWVRRVVPLEVYRQQHKSRRRRWPPARGPP